LILPEGDPNTGLDGGHCSYGKPPPPKVLDTGVETPWIVIRCIALAPTERQDEGNAWVPIKLKPPILILRWQLYLDKESARGVAKKWRMKEEINGRTKE
jgi:hypothetical protein